MPKPKIKDLVDLIKGSKLPDGRTGQDVLDEFGTEGYIYSFGNKYSSKPGSTLDIRTQSQGDFMIRHPESDFVTVVRQRGGSVGDVPRDKVAEALVSLAA